MPDIQLIHNRIYELRGVRVMLDFDLAELYEITTSHLKRSVRRNIERFPPDFMFELAKDEANELINSRVSQFGTPTYNFSAYAPFAFTEQGVAMLSSVLRSPKAIEVNIIVMRAFVQMRQFLLENKEIILSIDELKRKIQALERVSEETLGAVNDWGEETRKEIDDIYVALAEMADTRKNTEKTRKSIGYITRYET